MSLSVQLKKNLGSFQLDVEFETENEVFAIMGASGSGKSMTLKCIAGIERPDEGRIVCDGTVFFDSNKKIDIPPQKRKVGYLFQDYALFPNMTVEKNIMAGMGRRSSKTVLKKYIEMFHLEGLEKNVPSQLSGGQKQRVAMARMLAAEPEVILLDEPFSALDSYLRWQLEQEMADVLAKLGKSTLFVSHNRDEVYRLSDTVCCLNRGKIDGVAPVKEFFHNPHTVEAALLSGCKNISQVNVIDEHHVEAIEWNMILECETIPAGTDFIGIRAHSFEPVYEEVQTTNCFQVKETRCLEEPFEWNMMFRHGNAQWIQWRFPKKAEEEAVPKLPPLLKVKKEDILLLKNSSL